MSAKVDQFCNGLRDRLNAIEARMESIKSNVEALPGVAEKALQDVCDAARAKLQSQKERIEKTRADLKTWGDQKMAETQTMVREWKAKHEAAKLNTRAERAEAYAEAAVFVALASIDEAEQAMLEAALARKDAEGAK